MRTPDGRDAAIVTFLPADCVQAGTAAGAVAPPPRNFAGCNDGIEQPTHLEAER